ncbi:helix-turn-helix domain-containing protein [Spirochaeta lutea]|uniref:HTH cro/C1-type domain-containing protein n=1 Tax=Spirochaeta lutea TaxID=1480694 RepID=A0A098R167_9SPIO|nr:helix-turn-helix transcriptional regulator [Spirochaeta lutea]KGE73418.1 hypothetical protein DC28_03905 [Spirochaeta lutea]
MKYSLMNDQDIMEDLARRIDSLRIQKHLKDSDIESLGGISRQLLSDFRRGKRGISLKSFIRILRGLGEIDRLDRMLPREREFRPHPDSRTLPVRDDQSRRVRDTGRPRREFTWGDEE